MVKWHDRLKTTVRVDFGKAVRIRRYLNEWSQELLAEKAGLHPTYISSVERGERNISLENIIAIARALKCSPRELLPED